MEQALFDADRVAVVRGVMPEAAHVEDLARVFVLLGDPNRLRMLTALLAAGELCVSDLAAVTGMSESSVSHALRLLRASRVVTAERRGRMVFYRLDDEHVRLLVDLGLTHARHTDDATEPG